MRFSGPCCSVGWLRLRWLPTLPSVIYAGKACLEVGMSYSAVLHVGETLSLPWDGKQHALVPSCTLMLEKALMVVPCQDQPTWKTSLLLETWEGWQKILLHQWGCSPGTAPPPPSLLRDRLSPCCCRNAAGLKHLLPAWWDGSALGTLLLCRFQQPVSMACHPVGLVVVLLPPAAGIRRVIQIDLLRCGENTLLWIARGFLLKGSAMSPLLTPSDGTYGDVCRGLGWYGIARSNDLYWAAAPSPPTCC